MHIAIVTAGGAGMFCGSCMHDNTWARALQENGCEVSLIPTYTPVRVDEVDVSTGPVLLGGINVYLDHYSRLWGRLPGWMTGWLDNPAVIRMATKWGVSNDATHLGPLTIDMLKGIDGPNRREVEQFVEYFSGHLKPDAIIFSNALLAGVMPALRNKFNGTILCTLQGDDIFLDQLPAEYRTQSIDLISQTSELFDGFLSHSRYYQDYMSEYLKLKQPRFANIPLGIDLEGHTGIPEARGHEGFRIGYFARICPEKGIHRLISAFREFRKQRPNSRLLAGGYLGKRDAKWFKKQLKATSDLGDSFEYIGSPDTHEEKVAFLSSIDVLSVPTEYREPKGLYVIESLANGTPVVQPDHGAFPELLEATGGGLLFDHSSEESLVARLIELHDASDERVSLAQRGQTNVREAYSPRALAEETLKACRSLSRHSDED